MAQWRLQLRTEVKRASSLPSSMFDACDPMLETRLAETAEAMLTQLHEPPPQVATPDEPGDKRIETVTADELRALPALLRGDDESLALDDGLRDEYLGVLADTCCLATGPAQLGAAQLLQRDFDVVAADDLDQLTARVAQCLAGLTADAPVVGDAVQEVCRRIAATVALHVREPEDPR